MNYLSGRLADTEYLDITYAHIRDNLIKLEDDFL